MASPSAEDRFGPQHEQHVRMPVKSELPGPPSAAEPGVGQLVSQIQHIIKDSAGSPPSRPQSSGYSSPKYAAPLITNGPSAQQVGAIQTSPMQDQQDQPSAGLEEGMSEISISGPPSKASNGPGGQGSSLAPRLSAPRRSLQPPTSPFALDEDPLEEEAMPANGNLDEPSSNGEATTRGRGGQTAGNSQQAPAANQGGRYQAGANSMDDAEDIDVGGDDKDRIVPGVAVQARPFSPPPGTAAPIPTFSPQEPPAEFYEPPEFKGLLFYDGVDSLGRPVVVVDFDVVSPSTIRSTVMQYILQRLEPIVSQGPYVLVMLTTGKTGTSYLKGAWLISAYKNLSRPFRKNVKYILMVKPSNGIRALLLLFKPFISRKAHSKLKKVNTLAEIASVTNNEVQLQHLGPRFASSAGQYIAAGIKSSGQSTTKSFEMPGSGPT